MNQIALDKAEDVIREQTGLIDEDDACYLIIRLYEAANVPCPQRLLDEAEARDRELDIG